jgi:peroxiredoxin family protein
MAEIDSPGVGVRPADRVVIFVHSGDYDRLHEAMSVAATAAAAGRAVDVVFSWFALEALVLDRLATPTFPNRPEVEAAFEDRSFPTAAALAQAARASGTCTFYGCTGSAGILGLRPDRVAEVVDHAVGWSTILQVTRAAIDRFSF